MKVPPRHPCTGIASVIKPSNPQKMQSASPTAFCVIVAADRIVRANRETIEGCSKAATRARETARCTIKVTPGVKEGASSQFCHY